MQWPRPYWSGRDQLYREAGKQQQQAGGAAVAAADLSGLSNAEVERIWLPFMPWIAVAATAVVTQRSRRWWLATSLALGLALQVGLVTPW